ncbi:MAG: hypothetical protein GXO27_01075 [Chlorobi bacterium]|nr:hypothetical protein [Chlorobiota bacterium]
MTAYLHGVWAFFTLAMIVFTIGYHIPGLFGKRHHDFGLHLRLALFTLVVTGIQIILGLITLLASEHWKQFRQLGMGRAMKNDEIRLMVVEHPTMSLLGFLVMLYGFRRMYYQPFSRKRFLSVVIFYGLALLLIASRIPWHRWL